MVEYLDSEGKRLKQGFYANKNNKKLFYFTGYSNQDGIPVFNNGEQKNSLVLFYLRNVKELVMISKEEIKDEIKNLRNKSNWLEQKLKEKEIVELVDKARQLS